MSAPENPEMGGRQRRNSSIPAFLYPKPKQLDIEAPAPAARDPNARRISFDVGWLTRSVRRTSVDVDCVELPAVTVPQNEAAPKPTEEVDSSAPAPGNLPVPAPQNKGMGDGRKSESVLWKWFNTPMVQESSVVGKQVSENEEFVTPVVAAPVAGTTITPGSSNLSKVAQQMSVKTAEADTSALTGMDPGKFGALKMMRKNSSARDLNALSPSNW